MTQYAKRFPPQFVVVSLFANDFGDYQQVLEGNGDWDEGGYWLGKIHAFCMALESDCLIVPAPWLYQVDGPQMAGNYPGKISNVLHVTGPEYLDPIAEFATAQLEIINKNRPLGLPSTPSPLFNGRIGDGHFSARGAEIWASAVGRRLALLIEKRRLAPRRSVATAGRRLRVGKPTCWRPVRLTLLADHLDEHPLGSTAVELSVKDLLPGAEIQLPLCDRHHNLAAHDLAFVMGVGIVFAGAVVLVSFR